MRTLDFPVPAAAGPTARKRAEQPGREAGAKCYGTTPGTVREWSRQQSRL
ncbi:hypothetical protein GZL_02882 [Streptomyces sp. 769]|nr:hypothetical protein GZL_02882 [Streptomyces sp. 769]